MLGSLIPLILFSADWAFSFSCFSLSFSAFSLSTFNSFLKSIHSSKSSLFKPHLCFNFVLISLDSRRYFTQFLEDVLHFLRVYFSAPISVIQLEGPSAQIPCIYLSVYNPKCKSWTQFWHKSQPQKPCFDFYGLLVLTIWLSFCPFYRKLIKIFNFHFYL